MSELINLEEKDPIDYTQCYKRAMDKYESIYMDICELYLLSRGICEFSDELFDCSLSCEIMYQRCIDLYVKAEALPAEFNDKV